MPITGTEIKNQMASALDAEGSDHYKDSTDYIPAINSAIDDILTIVDLRLGNNKFTEEALRELSKVMVYETSIYSRINVADTIRSIRAVIPNVTTVGSTSVASPATNASSRYLLDLAMTNAPAGPEATRITAEAMYKKKQLYKRSALFTSDILTYFYCYMEDYTAAALVGTSPYTMANPREIEIFPDLNRKKVALKVIKNPTKITSDITISLEFPIGLKDLLVNLALFWTSFKQGDGTNINGVSREMIQQKIQKW